MSDFIRPALPFKSTIIPVLDIEDIEQALPLSLALYEGGLDVAEVTFRLPHAHKAIESMKKAAPKLSVGAGTVLNEKDLNLAFDAGADFIVTPVMTPNLLRLLSDCKIPVFPGVSTPGEAQALYDLGYSTLKFFPAEASGGVPMLKAIGAPLPHLTFMATGGIDGSTAPLYLKLPNVAAVGGSWIVNKQDLKNSHWDNIREGVADALAKV